MTSLLAHDQEAASGRQRFFRGLNGDSTHFYYHWGAARN